ncbi:MAG: hypothetical protein ACKO96_32605, partial [Flammeovirgaceae bacterium]
VAVLSYRRSATPGRLKSYVNKSSLTLMARPEFSTLCLTIKTMKSSKPLSTKKTIPANKGLYL